MLKSQPQIKSRLIYFSEFGVRSVSNLVLNLNDSPGDGLSLGQNSPVNNSLYD